MSGRKISLKESSDGKERNRKNLCQIVSTHQQCHLPTERLSCFNIIQDIFASHEILDKAKSFIKCSLHLVHNE